MTVSRFVRTAAGSVGVASAVQAGDWVASRGAGRVNVVDEAWGPGLVGIAVFSALSGTGDRRRRSALATGVTAWGARLGIHVHRRSRGRGEDPRYVQMLEGASMAQAIAKVFVSQGAAQWVISLPIQVASSSEHPAGGWGERR